MDDTAPPPYSLIAPVSEDSSSSSSQFNPRSLTSYLHSHIAALPDRIRQTQQTRNAQQVEADIWILDHLAPIVESFLADLGAQRTAPALATLTLVPKSAVPVDAQLSGIEDMLRRNEVGRVFRVDIQQEAKCSKGDVDSKGESSSSTTNETSGYRAFTDWGRWEEPGSSSVTPSDLLWWKDEELAQRLASYLQPQTKSTPRSTIRSPVQVAVEQTIPAERSRKGWGLSRLRSNQSSPSTSSSTVSLPVSPHSRENRPGTVGAGDVAGVAGDQLDNGKRAEMNVAAEELAFRRENDFGIWESIGGWAIVVTVNVHS
ncbi:hypothetical protein SCAR479_04231 [Seiridium cardinale]|uniref:Uncharacterized protein n=1 Tax=Seiridium cardinale TaxID=138064 RepID=A0ABR2XYY2_9PEZI